MQDVIIYLGPSLPINLAEEILPAHYLPPIRREDLIEIIRIKPKIIGIIDGVFFEKAAVGHREILQIIKQGIQVVGASSMGALRAAELEPFGMIGVGKIFRMYRDGVIESDDEVALMCDPVTNVAYSEALVNVRITLESAYHMGIITADETDEILNAGKKIWYPERNWDRLLRDGISDESRRLKITEWIENNKIDQKREDACEALQFIKGKMINDFM